MSKFRDGSNIVVGRFDSKSKIVDLFVDLQAKWAKGMNIKDYKEKPNGELMMRMNTFFDDDLIDIGSRLVDAGKTTVNAWVVWMSCCEFHQSESNYLVVTRSSFYEERARDMFAVMMAEHLKKCVDFTSSPEVKARVAA